MTLSVWTTKVELNVLQIDSTKTQSQETACYTAQVLCVILYSHSLTVGDPAIHMRIIKNIFFFK